MDILGSVPHAFEADDDVPYVSGRGWRVVPRAAIWIGRYWKRRRSGCAPPSNALRRFCGRTPRAFHVSAREITAIEEELDEVYGVLQRAEAAGVAVNVSYVA